MRHRVVKKKLGRDLDHRKALRRNLATELIDHESVETTLAKAKFIRPYVEKLVTYAKNHEDRLVLLRYLRSHLSTEEAVRKVIDVIAPRYKSRPGGYVRIKRIGNRDGDNALLARISFVEEK